jgi:hypothetical protein
LAGESSIAGKLSFEKNSPAVRKPKGEEYHEIERQGPCSDIELYRCHLSYYNCHSRVDPLIGWRIFIEDG